MLQGTYIQLISKVMSPYFNIPFLHSSKFYSSTFIRYLTVYVKEISRRVRNSDEFKRLLGDSGHFLHLQKWLVEWNAYTWNTIFTWDDLGILDLECWLYCRLTQVIFYYCFSMMIWGFFLTFSCMVSEKEKLFTVITKIATFYPSNSIVFTSFMLRIKVSTFWAPYVNSFLSEFSHIFITIVEISTICSILKICSILVCYCLKLSIVFPSWRLYSAIGRLYIFHMFSLCFTPCLKHSPED